jgi:hypothetical protein
MRLPIYPELSGLDANPTAKKKVKAKPRTTKPAAKTAVKTAVVAAAVAAPVAAAIAIAPTPATAALSVPNPTKQESALDKLLATAQQVVPTIVSTVAAARNQKRIDKIQEQRLAAGKEPLTAEEIDRYMDATAPVVKVKGGVDNNTSKAMMYGGAALGLGVLYMMMNRNKSPRRG